jgi:hypothetical protein
MRPRHQGKTIRKSRFPLKDRPGFVKLKDFPERLNRPWNTPLQERLSSGCGRKKGLIPVIGNLLFLI